MRAFVIPASGRGFTKPLRQAYYEAKARRRAFDSPDSIQIGTGQPLVMESAIVGVGIAVTFPLMLAGAVFSGHWDMGLVDTRFVCILLQMADALAF